MGRVAAIAEEGARTVDPMRLRELANHTSKSVRIAVAENRHSDDETIEQLMHDDDAVVRLVAAGGLADRPSLQQVALASPDRRVRSRLAATFLRQDDRSLPYDVQAALASDGFFETREPECAGRSCSAPIDLARRSR